MDRKAKNALQEGRSAVSELDRQLNAKRNRAPSAPPMRRTQEISGNGLGGVRQEDDSRGKFFDKSRFSHERQNLDKASRTTRLNHRKDAPLGSLEELDDRGLIGGGSIPSTYSSSPLRLRARRQQEMKDRSARLQDREDKGTTKYLKTIFHVFNFLVKRGLSIEDCFRHRDAQKNGFLKKKSFVSVFQQIGVPLGLKDLLKVARAYAHPQSHEHVDYERLLRDFSLRTSQVDVSQTSIEGSVSIEGTLDEVKIHRNVLLDLKAALMQSTSGMGKSIDDVYGVFVRWDSKGTGTITSAQFLRALDRLHVGMSDEDQDTLIEILDCDSVGKIYYEGLLDSCFPQVNVDGVIRDSLAVDELSENASISGGSLAASIEAATRDPKPPGGKKGRPQTASSSRPTTFILTDNNDNESLSAMGNSSPASYKSKRPLTAAPRLFKTEYESRRGKPQESIEADFVSDPFVIEVSDSDNIIDDEPHVPFRPSLNPYSDGNSLEFGTFNVDVESFNDNTLLSDQDEFIFPSPRSPVDGGQLRQQFNMDPNALGRQQQPEQRSYYPKLPTKEMPNKISTGDASSGYTYEDYRSSLEVQAEPKDHLILLATQSLATLREMILARHFTGISLKDIFHHFDRKGKFYFDAKDLMVGMADLRIETPEKVADLMISLLAIDGHDKVSFGEFSVFITDNDHLELERDVQSQVADQLERQGRDYQMHLYNAFWDNTDAVAGIQSGMVGRALFERALARLGILLSSSDIHRLITRFSIHGQDQCSVTRFLRMVQNSSAWRKSEKMLAIKEEATEEAQTVIAQLKQGVELVPGLTLDIIHMAEYLGIRVLSEPSLLWIASEAFVAPLPTGWITSKDKEGRLFFYNSTNNISQWDHPLDNHFRKLRDKHREEAESGNRILPPPANAPFSMGRPVSHSSNAKAVPSSSMENITWRDAPHRSLAVQRLSYDSRTAGRPISAGGNAVFPPLRPSVSKPSYPSIITSGNSAKGYAVDKQYESNKIIGGGYMRPSSAAADSYTRRKFQTDGIQPRSARESFSGHKVVSGNSSDASSIIDRAVNYGKDTPTYLRPKGVGRAQSAGHQRTETSKQSKQLAMMYAEELIEKLDAVILKKESESIPVEVGGSGRGIRGKRDKNETPVGGIVVL